MLQTYRTKIKNSTTEYLDKMATFSGYIERKLFRECFIQKRSRNSCKNAYTRRYGITSRQFNAIYILLQGKVDAVKEANKFHISELKDKIKSLEFYIKHNTEKLVKIHAKIIKLEKIKPYSEQFKKTVKQYRNIKFLLHQKKRKLTNYKYNVNKLDRDIQNNKIRICFSSKDLFKTQFNLKENNYKSHDDWKKDWLKARSSQFFCIGSKDESGGNQTCTYTLNNELRLRVADRFIKDYGTYIVFKNIKFPYGQEIINNAIQTYIGTTKTGNPAKYVNSAISYRFTKNEFGWYVNATTKIDIPDIITSTRIGAIGLDMNAGFISYCEIDRFGNPLKEEKIPINIYNRSTNQVTAAIGDAVKYIVEKAVLTQKPIIIENLDFSKKKSALGEESRKYSRMLSGFAYSKFKNMLKAKASKQGVEVIEVNPAYTSIIGQVKFMKRYGLSSHGSAACVIARRGLGFKIEKPKYNSILGDFSKFINHKPLKSRWSSISYLVKKKYYFNNRIELLKLEA